MEKIEPKRLRFRGIDHPCRASLTMGIIVGKWKTVILYHLMGETLRYNKLRKSMPSITERTLSLQLKALERWSHKTKGICLQTSPKGGIVINRVWQNVDPSNSICCRLW